MPFIIPLPSVTAPALLVPLAAVPPVAVVAGALDAARVGAAVAAGACVAAGALVAALGDAALGAAPVVAALVVPAGAAGLGVSVAVGLPPQAARTAPAVIAAADARKRRRESAGIDVRGIGQTLSPDSIRSSSPSGGILRDLRPSAKRVRTRGMIGCVGGEEWDPALRYNALSSSWQRAISRRVPQESSFVRRPARFARARAARRSAHSGAGHRGIRCSIRTHRSGTG